jgi:hypothetical protein
MSGPVEFDALRVKLLLPVGADQATADPARAALNDPAFLASVRRAVQAVLATVPALAVLSAEAAW